MDALYSIMQGLESRLGGGEGVEGIYGSITAAGMHKVLECMRHNCGLGKQSTVIDIGAGLGRPLLHALLIHEVAHGYGVELDRVKITSLEPGSHAYSFWEGVPRSGKQAFGRLFRQARTTKAVAVVQRAIRGQAPEAAMAELGFGPLLLIKAFPVNMSGEGQAPDEGC
eukprot:gene2166-2485_t